MVLSIITGAVVTGVCKHPHSGHVCKGGVWILGVCMMIVGTILLAVQTFLAELWHRVGGFGD